jgi:hypothetical protein
LREWGTVAPVELEDGRLRLYAFEQKRQPVMPCEVSHLQMGLTGLKKKETLEKYGAVSRQTAEEMALGVMVFLRSLFLFVPLECFIIC